MKQNITVSLDKELLRKGRVLAALEGTSLSRMVSEKLRETIQEKEVYGRAKKKALAQLKKGFHLGGRVPLREELYER
jgi:metal-responsive CopG/Arc/MetJ family transcriptional regulator